MKQTVNPIPMTIVSKFAPVLAVRCAFCVADNSAHFFSPPRESVICCRCGSALERELEVKGRGVGRAGRHVWRLAARRRARRVVNEADIAGLLDAVTMVGGGMEQGAERWCLVVWVCVVAVVAAAVVSANRGFHTSFSSTTLHHPPFTSNLPPNFALHKVAKGNHQQQLLHHRSQISISSGINSSISRIVFTDSSRQV